jgi:hypothetical protein
VSRYGAVRKCEDLGCIVDIAAEYRMQTVSIVAKPGRALAMERCSMRGEENDGPVRPNELARSRDNFCLGAFDIDLQR